MKKNEVYQDPHVNVSTDDGDILGEVNFDSQDNDMKEAYLAKLDEIYTILKKRDNEEWDTSSKKSSYLHNHTVDYNNRKVSELTVGELIDIIRMVVRQEHPGSAPIYIPQQPIRWDSPICGTTIQEIQSPTMVRKEQIND